MTRGFESCGPVPRNPSHSLHFLLPLLFSLFSRLIFCVSAVSACRLWGQRAIRNSPVQQTRPAVSSEFSSRPIQACFLGRSLQLGHSLNTMFRGLICYLFSFFLQFWKRCIMLMSVIIFPTALDAFVFVRHHELV